MVKALEGMGKVETVSGHLADFVTARDISPCIRKYVMDMTLSIVKHHKQNSRGKLDSFCCFDFREEVGPIPDKLA